jgi:catechol 2,3-dioxygenase-like lactoylglutathione lyase family enzyme
MTRWYSRPVLSVTDISRSIDFYVGKLGFQERWRHVENGRELVAQVDRGECELLLDSQWPEKRGHGVMFISLDEPVLEAFRAEVTARSVEVKDGRWGYRLAIVADPDGNQLFFPYPAD